MVEEPEEKKTEEKKPPKKAEPKKAPKKQRTFVPKVCEICGNEFIPTSGSQKKCKDCIDLVVDLAND